MSAKTDVLEDSLEQSRREYDDLVKAIAQVDSKAQNACTIAGVLLAAFLAIVGRPLFAAAVKTFPCFGGIADFSVALLLLTLCLGMFTVWARDVPAGVASDELARTTNELVALPDGEFEKALANHINGQLDAWNKALVSVRASMRGRATWLRITQSVLLTSIVVAAFVVFVLATVSAGNGLTIGG